MTGVHPLYNTGIVVTYLCMVILAGEEIGINEAWA